MDGKGAWLPITLALIGAAQAVALGLIATGDLSISAKAAEERARLGVANTRLLAYERLDYAFGANYFVDEPAFGYCDANAYRAMLGLDYRIIQRANGFVAGRSKELTAFIDCFQNNKLVYFGVVGPAGSATIAAKDRIAEKLAFLMEAHVQMKNP